MSRIEELEEQIQELQKKLKFEKQKTEIEYSIENDEEYFVLWHDGYIRAYQWDGSDFDKTRYAQGNVFKNREEARKERDKREILTRFNQFRDKCNGDWKPDFEDWEVHKYYLAYSYVSNKLCCFTALCNTDFQPFGYFKNRTDCDRAIELFGDEIIRLWVDE